METESYNFLNSLGSYATLVHNELLRAKTGIIRLSAVLQEKKKNSNQQDGFLFNVLSFHFQLALSK